MLVSVCKTDISDTGHAPNVLVLLDLLERRVETGRRVVQRGVHFCFDEITHVVHLVLQFGLHIA